MVEHGMKCVWFEKFIMFIWENEKSSIEMETRNWSQRKMKLELWVERYTRASVSEREPEEGQISSSEIMNEGKSIFLQ